MKLPEFYGINRRFPSDCISDVSKAMAQKLKKIRFRNKIEKNQTIGIGVGSRGIHDIKNILEVVVQFLKDLNVKPFIFPAMGSHGGATAKGQIKVLKELGITKEAIGVPIVSNMDVVSLGTIKSGAEIYFSKDALKADHIIVINRVKPHTAFRGQIESGLCKMLAVGCGKQRGALNMHRYDLSKTIIPAADLILKKIPLLFGVCILENAYGRTQSIAIAKKNEFIKTDKEFLLEAKNILPKLPFDDLDILIVDEMGKNISGAGIDPNVVGFWRREGGEKIPNYRTIIVLDLTEQTKGNATGIGSVDLTTQRVIKRIDWAATYMNVLTAGHPRSARMPVVCKDDKVAIKSAIKFYPKLPNVTAARIVNTGSLEHFWVTRTVKEKICNYSDITIEDEPIRLRFTRENRLLAMEE